MGDRKDWDRYLGDLRTRANEVKSSLGQVTKHLRDSRLQWPIILDRLSVLSSQAQSLSEVLLDQSVTVDYHHARLATENAVLQPTVEYFDPTQNLRTRPIPEKEQEDAQYFQQFQQDSQWSSLDAKMIESQFIQFNQEVLSLVSDLQKLASDSSAQYSSSALSSSAASASSFSATSVLKPSLAVSLGARLGGRLSPKSQHQQVQQAPVPQPTAQQAVQQASQDESLMRVLNSMNLGAGLD